MRSNCQISTDIRQENGSVSCRYFPAVLLDSLLYKVEDESEESKRQGNCSSQRQHGSCFRAWSTAKRKKNCSVASLLMRWGEAGGAGMREGEKARRREIMEMLTGGWCIGDGKIGER